MRRGWRTLACRLDGDGSLVRMQLLTDKDRVESRVQRCAHWLLRLLPFSLGWTTVPHECGEAFREGLAFNAPVRLAYHVKNDPQARACIQVATTAALRPGFRYLPIIHPAYDRFIASWYTEVRPDPNRPDRTEVWDPILKEWRPLETFFWEGAKQGFPARILNNYL